MPPGRAPVGNAQEQAIDYCRHYGNYSLEVVKRFFLNSICNVQELHKALSWTASPASTRGAAARAEIGWSERWITRR